MPHVTIPNRPTGTEPRHIAQLLADFDAITNVVNGQLDGSNMSPSIINGPNNVPSLRTLGTGPGEAAPGSGSGASGVYVFFTH